MSIQSRLADFRPRERGKLISVDIDRDFVPVVSVSEAKSYSRVDGGDEDPLFDVLIESAQQAFEAWTGCLIGVQRVTQVNRFEEYIGRIDLVWRPVQEVISVERDGEAIDFTQRENYIEVEALGDVTVTYDAGLNDIDGNVKLGCLKWINSNYDDRDDTAIGVNVSEMPNDSRRLWRQYKKLWL